ncbi:ABC transporter permease [Nannocystis sp.]|uniref:ABC transporter permease n=1 Tax=Nannocystis sp. TaxID=1962667 RepID=UPI0024233252|nr:ABC transporter permease [Nannocystis sp.]MBK7829072.1 ABC transporter permease [Nannocystis sp.]MBK9757533.1 ABC transporter permease [Nannocystis sp.]
MWVDWFLALRILRDGRMQTLLITSGVAAGVTVMVFLSSLMTGLEVSLLKKTLGTQAHVVVRPAEERARPLLGDEVVRRVEATAQRTRSIDGWQQLLAALDAEAGVAAASPSATAPVFAVRGNGTEAVVVKGVVLDRFARVIDLTDHMVAGALTVADRGAVIGVGLAGKLGVTVGDRLRLQAADGTSELFDVRGLFDLGNKAANDVWVLVALRDAQTLLALTGGVSSIELRMPELFAAEALAARLRGRTGLEVESWMAANTELLTALRSQASSSAVIQAFVILAVAIGIASVLVVSVIQRSREIGILRAMGMSRGRITRVFLLQGGLVGVGGSLLGSGLGAALAVGFGKAVTDASGGPLLPIVLDAQLFLTASAVATATGLLAALLPARRAARLDPATAIRNA